MSKILYTAVVLNENSKNKLIKKFNKYILDDFEIFCDHLTINSSNIDPKFEKYLGITIRLEINKFAYDNDIIVLGINNNHNIKFEKPYIIVAHKNETKNKSKLIKQLKDWETLKRPIYISGIIKEIELKL